ncbi:Tm-1-like ATP-binding domain-containing protein [Aspergillus clavatus NRRL 1]|uniref:UPF0261 domain protein n=1 Tax=Aspergillus clavatus (strain ATCC 1007 / CBS 513.65 / DSM 816 / NCTC 3887 / NRRL 1 / QM 1276 / 107) TaxID=344612 RepID=A1CQA3_ASPCL|nr:UPF0261 domain protein [Aspergillus clavatus NRRL 1]EAW07824.1 UPF0261 domain protein [Aspergillus clavatus NRRL 1]
MSSSSATEEEPSKATIVLMGTCDTKWDEMHYTQQQILSQHTPCTVLLMDIGHSPYYADSSIALKHPELCPPADSRNPNQPPKLSSLPRADYIRQMTDLASTTIRALHRARRIHAVLGIGGSCGTALATAVMQRALPVGFPKLMVSTMASGDVTPYVEETDLTLMYSVVDIAGTNRILKRILANAAAAIAGMAGSYFHSSRGTDSDGSSSSTRDAGHPRIGITMFGVTTPAVDAVRARLQQRLAGACEIYVFHATGAGGKAMERLVRERQLDAVVDLTTTEIADELVGGVLSAGPERLGAAAAAGIPAVISVGACDMVNFGARGSLPERFGKGRVVHEHNPTVTLVRTTPDECRRIARFMAEKLRGCATRPDRVRVVLPTEGISMLNTAGQPFYDPEADEALFSTLEKELAGSGITILRQAKEINDPEFADFVADSLVDLMRKTG